MSDEMSNTTIAWPIPCLECGVGEVVPTARAGRTAIHRHVTGLPVPAGLEIPTCQVCGAEWIDMVSARAIDTALEPVYRDHLRTLAARWIEALADHDVTQTRLEKLLGLSHGYLSKVRAGVRQPSRTLVSLLNLLASDPERRLQELELAFAIES